MSEIRRSRAEMRALIAQMKALEQQGKSRVEIARALGCSAAQVTHGLGAKRCWRHRRMDLDNCSTGNNKAKAEEEETKLP